MDIQSFDLIILGGGAAGCSLAWYASKQGLKSLVIEKSDSVGGLCRSWNWENFIVDTGPHLFHSPDEEITNDWRAAFSDLLSEGDFYSANYLKDLDTYFDYPLSKETFKLNKTLGENLADTIPNPSESKAKIAKAISFREYLEALVGKKLERAFFNKYPEKVWGIPTDEMLPDWAPKRVRITNKRETFFNGQYCAIANSGTGSIFRRIKKECETLGSLFLMDTEILNLKCADSSIQSIQVKNYQLDLKEDSNIVSTLPITIISDWLGVKIRLNYRGVLSTYFANSQKKNYIPNDYCWLYFQDDQYSFNRITEPTKMCNSLCLDKYQSNINYLIAETTFGVEKNIIPWAYINELKNKNLKDILELPWIDSSLGFSSSHNIEPYVYPIQDHNYKLEYKRALLSLSKITNLSLLGASSEFQYSDMQIIFRKSKDFIEDLIKKKGKDTLSISRNSFEERRKLQDRSFSTSLSLRPKVIVEIGINHNGSMELLYELIDSAVRAGGDIIKLQLFSTEKRIGEYVKELKYNEKAQDTEENIQDMLLTSELNTFQIKKAINYIIESGKEAMCSGFSVEDFQYLQSIKIRNIKVASMDFNNIKVHKFLSQLGSEYKIFLSTGMCSIEEIKSVLKMYSKSKSKLILMHCTSSYPLPYEDVNLLVLNRFKELFTNNNLEIGYSDHTVDNRVSIASLHYGVSYIEKHFTLNKSMRGPDHYQSMVESELRELIKELEINSTIRGSGRKFLQSSEFEAWRTQKKSLFASKKINSGDELNLSNVNLNSPPISLDPMALIDEENCYSTKDLESGDPIL